MEDVRSRTAENEEEISPQEKQRRKIIEKAEKAKDPLIYESYDCGPSEEDDSIDFYLARKTGRIHEKRALPCQDHCAVAWAEGCTILSCADGVSSCERSDMGARLACQCAEELIRREISQTQSEEELVQQLCSLAFREELVEQWISAVLEHSAALQEDGEISQIAALEKYGSTLMYALITENWYVLGNLGDGQILLFNEKDALKLRLHPPKGSGTVRALVDRKCYMESFQTGAFPRKDFSGVLLSTDGVYDKLSMGSTFHDYALQIKRRFSENREPLQPFCYEEEGQLLELSELYSVDDCSIVLALDRRSGNTEDPVRQEIDRRCESAVLHSRDVQRRLYSIRQGQDYGSLAVSPARQSEIELESLESAELLAPALSWSRDGWTYTGYPARALQSIAFLQSSNCLREQRERENNASEYVLRVYKALRRTEKELNERGLCLNESAHFLTFVLPDSDELCIVREAVSELGSVPARPVIWSYFDSLLGELSCGARARPIFDTGYVSLGAKLRRLDGDAQEAMCQVENSRNRFWLKNIGTAAWRLADGKLLPPEGRLALKDGRSFDIITEEETGIQYRYTAKESL